MLGQIIANTRNNQNGFWGTANNIIKNKEEVEKVWITASILIYQIADFKPLEIRKFLDSKCGADIAKEFSKELKKGTFAITFKNKINKERLYKDYSIALVQGEIDNN